MPKATIYPSIRVALVIAVLAFIDRIKVPGSRTKISAHSIGKKLQNVSPRFAGVFASLMYPIKQRNATINIAIVILDSVELLIHQSHAHANKSEKLRKETTTHRGK